MATEHGAVAFAEGKVTKLRREFKLLLSAAQAATLCERLALEEQAGPPSPSSVTSIYFDQPGLPLAGRAISQPGDCVKVRTKEYFPDLQAPAAEARVVLEVKRERNGLTQKRRVWLPRRELAHAFGGGQSNLLPRARGTWLPVLAVTYVRQVFQRCEAWRVTVDRDVAFHAVDREQAFAWKRLGREALGAPLLEEPRVVVEIKHLRAALPRWLASLAQGREHCFSKFAVGMQTLHRTALHAGREG
jgi:hypothetical protein